jgi:hypothetical protein
VFNAIFNNISVTWRKPSTYHWQTLSHNVKLSTPCHEIQLPYDHALSPLWEWKVFVSNLLTVYSPVLYLKIKKNRSKSHVKIKSKEESTENSGPSVTFPQVLGHCTNQELLKYSSKKIISQTCIKRSPLGQRKSGLIWQVTS